MDEWADGRTDGRTGGRTDGWMDGRTDGRADGRTGGPADGRAGGRTSKFCRWDGTGGGAPRGVPSPDETGEIKSRLPRGVEGCNKLGMRSRQRCEDPIYQVFPLGVDHNSCQKALKIAHRSSAQFIQAVNAAKHFCVIRRSGVIHPEVRQLFVPAAKYARPI